MSVLLEVLRELVGMFVADARLTIATLILVAAVAALVLGLRVEPLLCGGVLLAGCLVILIEAVLREARHRRAP
ncbi:hypothetical protein ACMDCR_19265 [Labrys okinawensis]|uniref:hypothetical protein n=1 Tax=Labrys okinawensis TaxID=346911 RepID=UPI0039BCBE90